MFNDVRDELFAHLPERSPLSFPTTTTTTITSTTNSFLDKTTTQIMVYTCNWGILATGGIASNFTGDLLLDPASRQVTDVRHNVAAVASSTSAARAKDFAKELKCPSTTKCYGSYEELVADPDVNIIYVATPHSHHYENAKLCLRAGKSVLCEKPFTINAEQTKHLVEIAREKKLFLMEAVWTRFFPLSIELQRLLFEEKIVGRIRKVVSDFGLGFDLDDVEHRLLNPKLGGGALLDLGIYNITWLRMMCSADPRNEGVEPKISSSIMKNERTGVDEYTNITMIYEKSRVNATMQCNMVIKSDEEAVVRIQGDEGDVTVQWPPFRPQSFTIYKKPRPSGPGEAKFPTKSVAGDKRTFDIPGEGMFWEADECARCIRDGKQESDRMPWKETIATMTIMDTARSQNDFKYPEELERVTE